MTDKFFLRPAAADDAPAIHALIRQAKLNPSGLNWQHFVLATKADGEMIGCGQIKFHTDGSHELASLAVVPAWQGKGVARVLLTYLLAEHPDALYLMCLSSLGPFYEKFGFHSLSEPEMPRYFRRIKKLLKFIPFIIPDGEFLLVMHRPQQIKDPK